MNRKIKCLYWLIVWKSNKSCFRLCVNSWLFKVFSNWEDLVNRIINWERKFQRTLFLTTSFHTAKLAYNGCGLKVVAASKPTNFQPTTNLVGRIHFPKPKTSHPFNLLLQAVVFISFHQELLFTKSFNLLSILDCHQVYVFFMSQDVVFIFMLFGSHCF